MQFHESNIAILTIVAQGMKDLLDQVVFVGGTVVSLYIDDPAAPVVRPTDDVDCVVKITSRVAHSKLEQKLRDLGFSHPVIEPDRRPLICRWSYKGIIVDVMPTDENLLGFSNAWYESGVAEAEHFTLPAGLAIRIFPVAHFLAAKLEAFKGRGRGDFQGSHDLEDIMAILDGRRDIVKELREASKNVIAYLKTEFAGMLAISKFKDSIAGHLHPGPTNAARRDRALQILTDLCDSKFMTQT